ncbi:MAG: hypothetical protein AAGA58_02370 [Verrucomicrobiota bacterium]
MKGDPLPLEEAYKLLTGEELPPLELTDPRLIAMRDEMAVAREKDKITTEEEWLSQLARHKAQDEAAKRGVI